MGAANAVLGAINPIGFATTLFPSEVAANKVSQALAPPPTPKLITPQGNEPTPSDPTTSAAMQDEEAQQRLAKGRASTYLSAGAPGAGTSNVFSKSLLAS